MVRGGSPIPLIKGSLSVDEGGQIHYYVEREEDSQ